MLTACAIGLVVAYIVWMFATVLGEDNDPARPAGFAVHLFTGVDARVCTVCRWLRDVRETLRRRHRRQE